MAGSLPTRNRIRPTIWRFVQSHACQFKFVAEAVAIGVLQDAKRHFGEIFSCRHDIQNHCFVTRNCGQKIDHDAVAAIYQKCVIPAINQFFLRDTFDVAKVHHHAIVGGTVFVNHLGSQTDFERVTVAVNIAALALVIWQAVAGVKFEAARDGDGLRHTEFYRQ